MHAREQAGMIVAQLAMLLRQLPYADRYNCLCRDDARATAAELIQAPAGGPRGVATAAALAVRLAGQDSDPHAIIWPSPRASPA